MTREYYFADLFSGCGGISWGFEQSRAGDSESRLKSVFAVDHDKASVESYKANFGDHAVCADIELLHAEKTNYGVRWEVVERDGEERTIETPIIDFLTGGPPCQGFSLLGTRDPDDPRNVLWQEYLRIVKTVEPKLFVMENVPQLLNSKHFEGFTEWLADELDQSYDLAYGILDASQYGVPQRRKRAIIVGSRVCRARLPVPTYETVSVKEAFEGLPLVPDGMNWHIGRNPTEMSLERYKAVPYGGNRFDLQKNRLDLTPDCWIRKESGGTDLFGRIVWEEPARCTVRTEFFKPEKGRYLHPTENRPITHREASRLQTFPDNFVFVGSKTEVARLIGNAVPPKLAKAIGETLIEMLDEYSLAGDDCRESFVRNNAIQARLFGT
jgi:DNA (cytosine-5)-methyltransferase 1